MKTARVTQHWSWLCPFCDHPNITKVIDPSLVIHCHACGEAFEATNR